MLRPCKGLSIGSSDQCMYFSIFFLFFFLFSSFNVPYDVPYL